MALELTGQAGQPAPALAQVVPAHWEVEAFLRDETPQIGDHWLGNNHHQLLIESVRVSFAAQGDTSPSLNIEIGGTDLFTSAITPGALTTEYTSGFDGSFTGAYIAAGTRFVLSQNTTGAVYVPWYGLRISFFGKWKTS